VDDVLHKSAQSKGPKDHLWVVVADIPQVESQLQHCPMAVSNGWGATLGFLPRFADFLVADSVVGVRTLGGGCNWLTTDGLAVVAPIEPFFVDNWFCFPISIRFTILLVKFFVVIVQ
jgi:hypothetical protein